MKNTIIGLTDAMADDLPLKTSIALVKENLARLDAKLKAVLAEQEELERKAARGEVIGPELARQAAKLKKLRSDAEFAHVVMSGRAARLEQELLS